MTLLASMNIAQQALLVNEAALSVVSNNIANVDTEGYSRQRLDLSPGVNYTPISGSATAQVYTTTGVMIDSVERYKDDYLTSYFRQQTSTHSYLGEYSKVASSIEDAMNELKGSGLSASMSKFYESVQNLNLNPSDPSARQNYIQQAQTVAIKFNGISGTLSDLQASLVGDGTQDSLDASKLSGYTTQANSKLQELVKVNQDIIKVGSSDLQPNSLLDRRDEILDELSALMPVKTTENTNGTITLTMNGIDIVKGTEQVGQFMVNPGPPGTPAVMQLVDMDGNVTMPDIGDKFISGEIGAILDACEPSVDGSLTIPSVLDELNKLASGFAEIVNNIQTGVDADGTPMAIDQATKTLVVSTENIFESSTGGAITAENIRINSNVLDDPYLIAAARVDIADYQPTEIGNNSNTGKLIETRTSASSLLDDTTPEGFISKLSSSIGLKVSSIDNSLVSQESVLAQVDAKLQSATGVNINEELMDLTKFQAAYQASARIYSVCNQLIDVMMNLGR